MFGMTESTSFDGDKFYSATFYVKRDHLILFCKNCDSFDGCLFYTFKRTDSVKMMKYSVHFESKDKADEFVVLCCLHGIIDV